MKQCVKCGQTLNDDAGFCTNCGAAVVSAVPQVDNAQGSSQMVDMGGMSQQNFASTQQPNPGVQQVGSNVVTNTQQAPVANKGKSNGKIAAIVAACAVCLIIGIVGIVLAIVSMNNNNNNKQVAVGGDPNNGNGTTVVDVATSGTKVEYAGYEFVIPDGYEYEISKDSDGSELLVVSKDSNKYAMSILYFDEVSFAAVESNADGFAENLRQEYPDTVAGSEVIDGVDFVYFNVGSYNEYNVAYLFSEADLYCFMTTIATSQESDPQNYFEDAAKVLSSAQKKSKMNRNIINDSSNLNNINSSLKNTVKNIE